MSLDHIICWFWYLWLGYTSNFWRYIVFLILRWSSRKFVEACFLKIWSDLSLFVLPNSLCIPYDFSFGAIKAIPNHIRIIHRFSCNKFRNTVRRNLDYVFEKIFIFFFFDRFLPMILHSELKESIFLYTLAYSIFVKFTTPVLPPYHPNVNKSVA